MACTVEGQVKKSKKKYFSLLSFLSTLFYCSFPFDRHSVYGYFYYNFTSYVCVYHYFGLLIIYGQFFLGICFYLNAFCQDFSLSIQNIDKLRYEYIKRTAATRDRIEFERALNEEICKNIDFQAEIVE